MKLQITGKNIEVTEAIKNYINEKIGGLEKYSDEILLGDVDFERSSLRDDDYRFRVSINLSLPHDLLYVEQTEGSLYAAIDLAREELEVQLKKHKGKYESKKREEQKTRRALKSIFFWRKESDK